MCIPIVLLVTVVCSQLFNPATLVCMRLPYDFNAAAVDSCRYNMKPSFSWMIQAMHRFVFRTSRDVHLSHFDWQFVNIGVHGPGGSFPP